jgi:hypothetical protein
MMVALLSALSGRVEQLQRHLRIQLPITIPPNHEPEPDGSIVRGTPRDYRNRLPGPGDVVGAQRCAELLDLLLHVGAGEAGEIVDQRFRPAVQLDVEAVQGVLPVDPAAQPLALRAAQVHGPMLLPGGGPVSGVDEVRRAVRAYMKQAVPRPEGPAALHGQQQSLEMLVAALCALPEMAAPLVHRAAV